MDRDYLIWTWNWRTVHPGPEVATPEDVPDIAINFVSGKTEHETLYGSIFEAAEAAICSINNYLENESPAERKMEEQRAMADQERKDRIQKQVNDFLG